VYDVDLLKSSIAEVQSQINGHNYHVNYAIKANYNEKLLKVIADAGLGADCVSGQEIKWALEAGFESQNVVFAGVGKTDEEILYAITNNIKIIHCEGFQEALAVNDIAKSIGLSVDVALRLNPNVNASTHEKITTGLKENKFGFSVIELNRLIASKKELTHLNIKGLHFHIGSQITDMTVFDSLCTKINELITFYKDNFDEFSYLNVGGGLGIDYDSPSSNLIPDFQNYFRVFKRGLDLNNVEINFELGRSIVGQCGKLLTKVLYVKDSETKRFAVVDAGMTELLRPALYDAYHQIEFNGVSFKDNDVLYDVVGPICESSDCLGVDVKLPVLKRGDMLTVRSCGAYAESMRLNYNGRKVIKSVYL
jgi:diaminopimelate decarboxylase